jgi:rhodanese-related sulfurtransferase
MNHHAFMRVAALASGLLASSCTPGTDKVPAPVKSPTPPAEAAVGDLRKPISAKVTSIGFDGFFALHQEGKTLVFDSRPAYHHQLGHIPGAASLPKDVGPDAIAAVENDIKQALAAGKTIVVYCSGMLCADARTLARRLAAAGYPASVFSGGWDAWRDAGLPVE